MDEKDPTRKTTYLVRLDVAQWLRLLALVLVLALGTTVATACTPSSNQPVDESPGASDDARVSETVESDESVESKVELNVSPPPIIDSVAFAPEGEIVELPESDHVLIGQPAPEFTMTAVESGEEVSLSDYAGQPVLVNFWATWCPPCRLEMPWFENVYQDQKDQGFVVLAVDAGERVPPDMLQDLVQRFVDGMALTFPVLVGDNAYEVQRLFSVAGLPASFLIGEDGTVVDAHQGAYPNQATLEDHLQQILSAGGDGAED